MYGLLVSEFILLFRLKLLYTPSSLYNSGLRFVYSNQGNIQLFCLRIYRPNFSYLVLS